LGLVNVFDITQEINVGIGLVQIIERDPNRGNNSIRGDMEQEIK